MVILPILGGFGAILALLAPPKGQIGTNFFYITGNMFISVENLFEDQISAA